MSNTKFWNLSIYDEELGKFQKEQQNEQTWFFVKQAREEIDRAYLELMQAIKEYTEAHWEINFGRYNIDALHEVVMYKASEWRALKYEWQRQNDWYFQNCI